jgi:hypothetical protein
MAIVTSSRPATATLRPASVVLSMVFGLALAACNSDGSNQDAAAPADDPATAQASGEPFDLSDVGMRGRIYTGEAVLLENGESFPETEFEINTRIVSLSTSALDLGRWDDPALEYRGEPALMRFSISGVVEDHEPGRITVSIESFSPRLTDQGGSALGTNEQERILEALINHDIVIPDVSSDAPLSVTFDMRADDDTGREALQWTTDNPALQSFDGSDGRRAPL